MSLGEYNDENPLAKKRRLEFACDICRKKETHCDGGQMPGNKCSKCVVYASKCTYVEAEKECRPSKEYVGRLESRLEKLEILLGKICLKERTLKDLEASENDDWFINANSAAAIQQTPSSHIATTLIRGVSTHALSDTNNNDDSPAAGDDADELAQAMSNLLVREPRFVGKASPAGLVDTALEVRTAYTGCQSGLSPQLRRPKFWSVHPWEDTAKDAEKANYTFPPPELLASLMNHYFASVNLFLPLLHRPTFERSVASGLHLTDDGFAATLLLVCALGSRYSNDERVKLDGVDDWHSSGWKWFDQVQVHRRSYCKRTTFYDLQFYCLAVQYLRGASMPHSCWTMVGIGIRQAQDAGAHRRKRNSQSMTIEDELWKRAFWVLVCLDVTVSVSLGRPCAIQDEDFDLDFPVECDDEYWFTSEDPDEASKPALKQRASFKQPPDKPSLITAFVLSLKLNKVLAVLMRTIYSLNKNKVLLGLVGRDWEQQIVSELDSTLNQWADSIPDYLRWDPNRENARFFDQSASLYCLYYYVQILIHRPFIPSPNKPSTTTFPSLAICTNAARTCSHILDAQRTRGIGMIPHLELAAFTAAIVLLLNMWCGKTFGLTTDPNKEMSDVQRCMDVLRASEDRWTSAGRLRDILRDLAFAGPLPASPPMSNKRDRDADKTASQSTSVLYGSLDPPTSASRPFSASSPEAHQDSEGQVAVDVLPRTLAGSKRVNRHQRCQQQQHLPVYSTGLGRSHSSASSFGGSSSLDWMQNELIALSGIGNSVFPSEPTFTGDLGLYGPDPAASSPSLYPGVAGDMMFHHTAPRVQVYGSSGGGASARDPRVFPPLQTHTDDPSPTSFSSGDAAFFDTPGFWVASGLPASGPYTDNMTGSSAGPGMDRDPQALLSNNMYSMWSNWPPGLDRLDDWGKYMTDVSGITHSFQPDLPAT